MYRLKLKKAEEKKAAEEAAAASSNKSDNGTGCSGDDGTKMDVVGENGSTETTVSNSGTTSESSGLKLLGIGGKSTQSGSNKPGKRRMPSEIRIQKDISELDGGGTAAQVEFPNPNLLSQFNVYITPDSGFWAQARYHFSFTITENYPHDPPKVKCNTKIFHPNINLDGAVCLNILREDWKPVLDINAVILGLFNLFYEPNPDSPLNADAADLFRNDRSQFGNVVKRTLMGNSHKGEAFPRLV
mmetsp:Transcript_9120/g.9181  ORF Transcript_9120/g.9181 Transcript_9120/m.9181 type:complete len:243 (+) Transcript_9120:113-841(+)|eukprot:CAMPEP_0182416360 /NCGR_PEP_ID=MMETSP1167-20130531/639_1 /TAXON_ID=2988 /ORGANISM="Mallomonas Sp, Strain CCMP3275" /LENGTH=242 /DNA_ID=CAMNT_0024589051 /DNA_START=113 /DNA_END=841 /DNA_ORIENTATION=+